MYLKDEPVVVGNDYANVLSEEISESSDYDGFVNLEFHNLGPDAINSCIIQIQDHPDGEFYDFIKDSDFSEPANYSLTFYSTITPNNFTMGQKAHARIFIGSACGVQVAMRSAGTSKIQILGSIK
jgi:hypothetical protein